MILPAFLLSTVAVLLGYVAPDHSRSERYTLKIVGFLGLVWVLARLRGGA